MIALDILSDPICPWCWIGKRQLDQALAQRPRHRFAIRWRPFQLNPNMPEGGMDRREYLEAKFGGQARAAQVYAAIEDAAAAAGAPVDFGRIARTPNTVDAHRVIRWAGALDLQHVAAEELFVRYFELGEDIGDPVVLRAAAGRVGMDPELVDRLLAGGADREEVRAEDAAARKLGVQGVPTFVIAGRRVMTGAQPEEAWIRMVDELAAAGASSPAHA